MLSNAQRAAYEQDGFIVVPDVFSAAEIDELRRVTDEFVSNSASVSANDEIYDLEDSHSAREPRVRRLRRRISTIPPISAPAATRMWSRS